MSSRRKVRQPGKRPSSRPSPRVRRTRKQLARPGLQPEDYRLLTLATGLGVAMGRMALAILDRHPGCVRIRQVTDDGVQATLLVPQPDRAVLTAILTAVKDLPVASDAVDPDRRMGDALERLVRLDAVVARLASTVTGTHEGT
jgi:hypothetical protein